MSNHFGSGRKLADGKKDNERNCREEDRAFFLDADESLDINLEFGILENIQF